VKDDLTIFVIGVDVCSYLVVNCSSVLTFFFNTFGIRGSAKECSSYVLGNVL